MLSLAQRIMRSELSEREKDKLVEILSSRNGREMGIVINVQPQLCDKSTAALLLLCALLIWWWYTSCAGPTYE